jgi:hypothetical protein
VDISVHAQKVFGFDASFAPRLRNAVNIVSKVALAPLTWGDMPILITSSNLAAVCFSTIWSLVVLSACADPRPRAPQPGSEGSAWICSDWQCGTRGDTVEPVNRKNSVIYIDDYKTWLGHMVVRGDSSPLPSDCGALEEAKDTEPAGGALRQGQYTIEETLSQRLTLGISAAVHGKLSSSVQGNATLDTGIDRAINQTVHGEYSFIAVTHTLTSDALRKRVAQCPQINKHAIIYSMTVVQFKGARQGAIQEDARRAPSRSGRSWSECWLGQCWRWGFYR